MSNTHGSMKILEYKLAQLLADGPKTSDQMAEELGKSARTIYRWISRIRSEGATGILGGSGFGYMWRGPLPPDPYAPSSARDGTPDACPHCGRSICAPEDEDAYGDPLSGRVSGRDTTPLVLEQAPC